MNYKRFYFESKEVKTTLTKGWVEMDMDFTQMYDCFTKISKKLDSPTSFKLLFWLLAHKLNDSNGVISDVATYKEFNTYLMDDAPNAGIGYRTFTNCMSELKEAGALTKVARGHYYANPYMFWKGDANKRVEMIQLESKDPELKSLNP